MILRDALKWVDRRLSNRLLGHSIGLYPEIKGMRGRNSLKKSDSRIAQNIYHSGVCSVENIFSQDFISASRLKLDELDNRYHIQAHIDERDIEDTELKIHINSATLKVLNAEELFSSIDANYLYSLKSKLEELLQVDFEFISHMIWRNYHTDNPSLFSGDWHFDRRPVNWLRLFVLMEDVDFEQGPFHYLDRESSIKCAKSGFNRESSIDLGELDLDNRVNLFIGNSGDAAFVDTQRLLHKAGVPEKNCTRDIVQIIISVK